jgi:hypothetical protein
LPGLCALIFGIGLLSGPSYNSGFTPFILVGFGGIMLIRSAIRGRRDLSTPKAVCGRSSLAKIG